MNAIVQQSRLASSSGPSPMPEGANRIGLEPIVEAMPDMRSRRFSANGLRQLGRLGRRAGSRRGRGLPGRGVT